jgi:dihydroflavonol-4-reductase
MKVLVTGANGFVGAAVTRALSRDGYEVKAMVRETSDRRNLAQLDVETVVGDLRDDASLATAVKGCTAVFHVAADYRLWVPDPDVMEDINVAGTRRLLRQAMDAGVEKIVYTSSVATVGIPNDGEPGHEDTPVSLDDMIGPYKRTKFLAEQLAQRMAQEEQCPVVIVNPSTPIGPGDIKPTHTGQVIHDAVHGRMPAYVDTGLNIVHVDDVATGHLQAFKQGRSGQRYILGSENVSLKQLLEQVADMLGRTPPRIRIPHQVAMGIAFAAESWARASGKPPRVTLDGVRMSRKMMYFSSNKARQELGYEPRPAVQAVEDAVSWFK